MIGDELETALKATAVNPRDGAVVALARAYAARIDEKAAELAKYGPPLLAALRELRMTPASRPASAEGGESTDADDQPDELDELVSGEQQRTAGQHGPAPVD